MRTKNYQGHGKVIQTFLLMCGETPTSEALSRVCHLSRDRAKLLLNNRNSWHLRDMDNLIESLNLNANDVIEIFFPDLYVQQEKTKTETLMEILSDREKIDMLQDIILEIMEKGNFHDAKTKNQTL